MVIPPRIESIPINIVLLPLLPFYFGFYFEPIHSRLVQWADRRRLVVVAAKFKLKCPNIHNDIHEDRMGAPPPPLVPRLPRFAQFSEFICINFAALKTNASTLELKPS